MAAVINPGLGGLINLAALVLNLWASLGLASLLLKVARGEPAELEILFTGGPYLGRALLATLVYGLVIMVIAIVAILIVALGVNALGPAALIVSPVFAVGVWILLMMFWWYEYILVDINPPGISCLSLSREIMSGNYVAMALISICSSLIAMIGILLCFVGLIFTVPLSALIMAVAYDQLTGGHERFGDKY